MRFGTGGEEEEGVGALEERRARPIARDGANTGSFWGVDGGSVGGRAFGVKADLVREPDLNSVTKAQVRRRELGASLPKIASDPMGMVT